ncbi:MAG: hypothetical protein RHS_3507 [Robinsoniella sp. RHS]|nr:MAG: hypothetical protein RHS_3507 [Robinsoniella sp. RHS]
MILKSGFSIIYDETFIYVVEMTIHHKLLKSYFPYMSIIVQQKWKIWKNK